MIEEKKTKKKTKVTKETNIITKIQTEKEKEFKRFCEQLLAIKLFRSKQQGELLNDSNDKYDIESQFLLRSNEQQQQDTVEELSKEKLYEIIETVAAASAAAAEKQTRDEQLERAKRGGKPLITSRLAIDCEFVGGGPDGSKHILARASIVNEFGECVYDVFVKPSEPVTDYRTSITGITEAELANGATFDEVRKHITNMIQGKVLIGHSIDNDLRVLRIKHPAVLIRDTAHYAPLLAFAGEQGSLLKLLASSANGNTTELLKQQQQQQQQPSDTNVLGKSQKLSALTERYLGISIQRDSHDSREDARATLWLYKIFEKEWEKEIKIKRFKSQKPK